MSGASPTETVALTALPADAGERVDKFLARALADRGVSRARIQELVADGHVTASGEPVRASMRMKPGMIVHVALAPRPVEALPEAEDIPLRVVFEDDHVLVVDKPAGLVVHPARGNWSGTLVNALLHHTQIESAEGEGEDDDADPSAAMRPGIVHRIDKDTSGLLVVAKTPAAREHLKAQFAAHTTRRRYAAVVQGSLPDTLTLDTLYARHPRDRVKFSSRVTEGRRAVTHVRVIERYALGEASLVHCTLETGRTHQIRVHLSDRGHPLLGDALYGRTPRTQPVRDASALIQRQALHAEMLGFVHPDSGALMQFESPWPDDFTALVNALRTLGIDP